MPKANKFEVDGLVIETLPRACFKVKLDDPNYPVEHIVTGYISGKMRLHYIKILPGDRVRIELDPIDLTKGRIVFRYKETPGFQRQPHRTNR